MNDKNELNNPSIDLAMYLRVVDELQHEGHSHDALPELSVNDLDPEQLAEFRMAQRCLALINASASSAIDIRDQKTNPWRPNCDTTKTSADHDASNGPTDQHTQFVLNTDADSEIAPAIPNHIGRFRIKRELGRGGFGVVLLAHDPNLKRDVALKIPKLQILIDASARQRFQREARSAAILSHPAIVPIYESGKIGPIHYIAFEYCQGRTLAQHLSTEKTMAPMAAAKLFVQLADAVQHAHVRGVVHRDLKPGNILVKADQVGTVQARITDFGLARIDTPDELQPISKSKAIIGTPSYMSPEQARGENDAPGPSVDIYALGAVLYECLTGVPPIKRKTYVETLHAIMNDTPCSPRKLNREIPVDLAEICMKCLRKDSAERYLSANELMEDLNRYIAGRPVTARPLGRFVQTWRWCKRNPIVASLAMLFFCSIVVGAGLVAWQWKIARDNLNLALQENQRAQRNVSRVEHASDEMINNLTDQVHLMPEKNNFRRRLLTEAIQLQQQLVSDDELTDPAKQVQTIQTQMRIARLQQMLGSHADAQKTLLDAKNRLDQLPRGTEDPRTTLERNANIILMLGQTERDQIHYRQAAELGAQAQEMFRTLLNNSPSNETAVSLAVAHQLCGEIADYQSQHTTAESELLSALAILENLPEDRDLNLAGHCHHAAIINSLAIIFNKTGRVDQAAEQYQKAIALSDAIIENAPDVPKHHAQNAGSHHNLANLLVAKKEYIGAAAHYRSAVETLQRLHSDFPNIPDYLDQLAAATNGLGLAQFRLSNTSDAKTLILRSIQLTKKLEQLSGNSETIILQHATALTNLSKVYRQENETDLALESLSDALRLKRQLLETRPDSINYMRSYAITCTNLGKLHEQRKEYSKAIDTFNDGMKQARTLVDKQPNNTQHRDMICWFEFALISVQSRMGEHASVFDRVDNLRSTYADDPAINIGIVRQLAECLRWMSATDQLDEKSDDMANYRSLALEIVQQLRSTHPAEIDRLEKMPQYQLIAKQLND